MHHVQTCEDWRLLEAYTSTRSDDAFRQIVERHGRWVFAAAYRQLQDRHLAEDAAQVVFILLARRANAMHIGPKLSGWLFNTLQFTVKNMRRMRARRARYEHQAAAGRPTAAPAPVESLCELALQLDAAVSRLSAPDRTAILLRFYQDSSFQEIAAALGVSEEAARKRVGRAVIALRRFLGAGDSADDSGISATAALGMAIAPLHLTQNLTTVALAAKAGAALPFTLTAATKGTAWLMALTKLQTAALVTAASLAVAVPATMATVHYLAPEPAAPQVAVNGVVADQPAPAATNNALAEFNRIYVLKADEVLIRIPPPFADSRPAGYAQMSQAQMQRSLARAVDASRSVQLPAPAPTAGMIPTPMPAPAPAMPGQGTIVMTDQDGNVMKISSATGGDGPPGPMVLAGPGGTSVGGPVRAVRGAGLGGGGVGGGGMTMAGPNGAAVQSVPAAQAVPTAMVLRWIENKPSEIEYTQWGNVQGLTFSKLAQVLFKLDPEALEGDNNLLVRAIPGDFLFRDGVKEDLLRRALGSVLSDFLGTKVNAEFREVDRKVYVLKGKWNYQPVNAPGAAPADSAPNIHLYSTDLGRVYGSASGSGGNDPNHSILATHIARDLKAPVIFEVEGFPASLRISDHNVPGTPPDPKALLDHVAEQTGLTWTEETRKVRHLFIELPK